MTASVRQESAMPTVTSTPSLTVISNPFGFTALIGSAIECWVSWEGNNTSDLPSTILDSAGQAYTLESSFADGTSGQSMALYLFQNNASATALVCTATWLAVHNFVGLWLKEITGVSTSSFQVVNGQVQASPGTGAGAILTPVITPTAQPCLLSALCYDGNNATTVSSANTGTQGTTGWNYGGSNSAVSSSQRLTALTGVQAKFTNTVQGGAEPYITIGAVYTEASGTVSFTLPAATGTFALTGESVTLTGPSTTFTLAAAAGTFALTGEAATLAAVTATTFTLLAFSGTFNLTGAPSSSVFSLPAAEGSFALTGEAVTLTGPSSPPVIYTLLANAGRFNLTGANSSSDFSLPATAGSFGLTGFSATLSEAGGSFTLSAGTGNFTFTGEPVTFSAPAPGTFTLAAQVGLFALLGESVTLQFGVAAIPSARYSAISTRVAIPAKRLGETRRYAPWDFSGFLDVSEVILTANVTAIVYSGVDLNPQEMIIGPATVFGPVVSQLITGGMVGTVYELLCTVETSFGQTLELVGYFAVIPDLA